jgi:hypothetical protein
VNLNRLFVFGAIALVFAGLVLVFGFLGTPAHQRLVSIDEQRLDDLESVASVLHERYEAGGLPSRLPANVTSVDPVTKRSYEFRRTDATHYQLCAVFSTKLGVDTDSPNVAWRPRGWPHEAGLTCYKFDVTEPPTPIHGS